MESDLEHRNILQEADTLFKVICKSFTIQLQVICDLVLGYRHSLTRVSDLGILGIIAVTNL